MVPSVLGNFHPAHTLYAEVDGKVEIEFGEPEVKPTLNEYSFFGSMWMAPETFQKDSKPVSLIEKNQH